MVANQKIIKYKYFLGVVVLIIIGLSLMAVGKWWESNRPRNIPEINRGHPFEENYFSLNYMFWAVDTSVEMELYSNDYPDTENSNVGQVGFIKIPEGSPLELSYSCQNGAINIELYNKEFEYYFDDTSSKEEIIDKINEYRREYVSLNLDSSIEFEDWLIIELIKNALKSYISYLADMYRKELPGSEISVETAVSRMELIWAYELVPTLPGNLKIEYEYDHRELKYTIDYEGYVMEASGPLDVPARFFENNGILSGTLLDNSGEE